MTQPQYGYPPQPPQGYGQPAPQQYPPQQAPYQQPNGYAPPPQYSAPQGYVPPPVPQGPPLPEASIEDFLNQPNIGGGKGISWAQKPDGYTIFGVVARPITNGDVFIDTHPPTAGPLAGQVKTFRDGRPKQVLAVPLNLLVPDPGYPDGEARLMVRSGQIRDELSRAMQEAGHADPLPEAGAFLKVTLAYRKPGNNIATNVFAITYRSPGQWENDPSLLQQQIQAPQYGNQPGYGAPQQAPYQQQAPAQYAAPAQAAPNPQQYAQAQPQYGQQAYDPNPQAYQQAPQDQGTQQPQGQPVNPSQGPAQGQYAPQAQQPVQPQLPINVPPQAGPPVQPGVQPSALPPEKQALLARMQGQAAAGQPQQ